MCLQKYVIKLQAGMSLTVVGEELFDCSFENDKSFITKLSYTFDRFCLNCLMESSNDSQFEPFECLKGQLILRSEFACMVTLSVPN